MKSGSNASIVAAGHSRRNARTTEHHCAAPPSARSSLSTDVTTTWRKRIARAESATRAASSTLGGNGTPEAVAQNRQRRVHTSPRIIKVAVPSRQHSPWFGHRPLLHMVCNPWLSRSFDTSP